MPMGYVFGTSGPRRNVPKTINMCNKSYYMIYISYIRYRAMFMCYEKEYNYNSLVSRPSGI